MQTRTLEIGVGLFLLAGLLALLLLALRVSGLSVGNAGDTYKVYAYFDNIAGVTVRGKVTLAGVTIGKVTAVDLDRDSYTGRVTMEINQNVNNLPVDSTASILTAGLLGEKYIGISVGGDEDVLKDGSTIHDTQSALVLEDLIGKFLLNSVNKDEAKSEVFFHADSSASRPAGVPGGFPLLSMAAPTRNRWCRARSTNCFPTSRPTRPPTRPIRKSSTPLSTVSLGRWSMPKASPRA